VRETLQGCRQAGRIGTIFGLFDHLFFSFLSRIEQSKFWTIELVDELAMDRCAQGLTQIV
jgi:hypothetical protein